MLDIYIGSGPPAHISDAHRYLSHVAQQPLSNDQRKKIKQMLFKLATLQGLSQKEISDLRSIKI